jgi:F0F1-type ATP synthase delta subunit
MRYSPSHYAEALYDALQGKNAEERKACIGRFVIMLRKNRDHHALPVILSRYEKVYLKKNGLRKVDIVSTSALGSETHEEIKKIMGEKIVLNEKVKPDLVAGLTILLDDTLYIDASAKTRISHLFS